MKNLIIIGVGGFAREMYWHAQNSRGFGTEWQIKGFLDGDVKLLPEDYAKLPDNIPVLGDVDSYEIREDDVFTCAVGTPAIRRKLIEKMLNRGVEFVSIIDKTAYIVPSAKIGRGVILTDRTHIDDHAMVGDFAVVNVLSGLGHDAQIGKYTCVMAYVDITGGVKIGDEVFIGGSVVITPKSVVGDGAYIGAGSVVLRKVKAGAKVFGNPAIEI